MRSIQLSLTILLIALTSYADAGAKPKVLAGDGVKYSLTVYDDGKYIFSYQNNMSGKADLRDIIFINKKEAKKFISRIGGAFHSKDGSAKMFSYSNYQIRLLTEIGGVFMMVNEAGQGRSTFRISDEMFKQLDIL
jgi:hypothetical protein